MIWLFLIVGLVPAALGYPSGAPSERCNNMLPGHGPSQNGEAPFEITFPPGKTTYTDNEQIEVTLTGKDGNKFKGFLIEPRPSPNTYMNYGSIDSYPAGTRNPCENEVANKNVALTHSDKTEKSAVTFTWTAPQSNVGNIVFVFSVVQNFSTFWVKLASAPLSYIASEQTSGPTTISNSVTDASASSSSTNAQSSTETTGTSSQINRDPGCGVTKNCFPGESECSQDCDFLVTWVESGGEEVEFSLHRKTSKNNYWIAVGLSEDPKMGNDSVMECVTNEGQAAVMMSYNEPSDTRKKNTRFAITNYGVRFISSSYSDGILTCTFARKKNAEFAQNAFGRRRRDVTDESMFFDLSEKWYMLVAHGQSNQGSIWKHAEYPKISPMKIDFLTIEEEVTTPAMSDTGVIKKDSRCGESVGCYHDCDGTDTCGFLLTWEDFAEDVALKLTCKRPGNNVYCAIGMSKDKKMGDDSVFECVSSGGTVTVYVSYNDGRSNTRLQQDKFGISSMTGSHSDGILTCTFMRKKTAALATTPGGERKKRQTQASASTYFDMTKDWNLLYAYGNAIGGVVSKHSSLPTISSQTANFESFLDLSATEVDKSLVKLHGILMTAAWMFFAVIGIFMARFYKTVWPEGMEWCDQKRWFIIHRACMVTAFLLTAGSFVVIFVHVGGLAEIEGSNFQKSHPIIGIVVMSLALINPIMAVFRPHPGTSKRPIFNIAHTFVGTAAAVCSIVNIVSGTLLVEAFVPEYVRILIWVAIGWSGLIELISYIYDCQTRSGKKGEAYEMKPVSGTEEKQQTRQNVPQFKIIILALHVLTVLGLAAGVCVIIWLGDRLMDDDNDL